MKNSYESGVGGIWTGHPSGAGLCPGTRYAQQKKSQALKFFRASKCYARCEVGQFDPQVAWTGGAQMRTRKKHLEPKIGLNYPRQARPMPLAAKQARPCGMMSMGTESFSGTSSEPNHHATGRRSTSSRRCPRKATSSRPSG